jgi:hypothetical protein
VKSANLIPPERKTESCILPPCYSGVNGTTVSKIWDFGRGAFDGLEAGFQPVLRRAVAPYPASVDGTASQTRRFCLRPPERNFTLSG